MYWERVGGRGNIMRMRMDVSIYLERRGDDSREVGEWMREIVFFWVMFRKFWMTSRVSGGELDGEV